MLPEPSNLGARNIVTFDMPPAGIANSALLYSFKILRGYRLLIILIESYTSNLAYNVKQMVHTL